MEEFQVLKIVGAAVITVAVPITYIKVSNVINELREAKADAKAKAYAAEAVQAHKDEEWKKAKDGEDLNLKRDFKGLKRFVYKLAGKTPIAADDE